MMENSKKRLENLLSAEEIPENLPKQKKGRNSSSDTPSELRKAVLDKNNPTTKPKFDLERVSWEEFLNAIDRDERVGFQYQDEKIVPLDEKISPSDNQTHALLQLGDEIFGKIQLEGLENLSPAEKALIDSIAQQVSQHIENLRLVEQANQYRSEAEEASRQLIQKGWEEYLQTSNAPALGYFYDQKRVTTTNDIETIANLSAGEIITRTISVRDEPIGTVTLADIEDQTGQTQALLATVINGLSAHIENLRLLDETERGRQQLDKRAAELETVAKVSTAAAAIRDPESLLRSVVDLTNYSFKLYNTSVYLAEENEKGEKMLKLAAASGKIGHKMLKEKYAILLDEKDPIFDQVSRAHQVYMARDTDPNVSFIGYEHLPKTRSEMIVPMIVAEQFIGIFDVKAEDPDRFNEEDISTYTTLAAQTAVALQNAQLYEEQLATVERLRELDHLKSAFLANMSHELRTPLNSISGFTQVMLEGLDGPLSTEMQEDLSLIDKNTNHLLNLINEILDMAKIEAGKLSVTIGPANIHNVLEDVIRTTAPLARKNNLTMELDNQIPANLIVMADDMRIQQVMINLIGNAMKFTLEGGITIHATVDKDLIRIRVKDTGIGIPPDQLESIFEAFSQVDTSTTRKTGGTGLGLPISRRFIGMHNGRIWAESKGIAGEGSVFTIELPIVLPEISDD